MTKVIQDTIRDSGLSVLEVARRAGITQGQLSRFMRDERTLTLPAAEKVCRVLGLELRPVPKRTRKLKGEK
jgi:transcriptional regulator with XRE-family HTH domain